ncbi:lactate utilization protein [Patescibacteria group bacterium]|nr:lactate utilization protein [Patescibacteria group bacterium]
MFNRLYNKKELEALALKMKDRNFEVEIVASKKEALKAVKDSLPDGGEVMTGSSTTLNEIGLTDYLNSSDSKFVSLQAKIGQENDEQKRQEMRRKSVTADYFISSVNAVVEDGTLLAVDATGSRVGAMPFAAKKLVLVIGAQKITKNLEEAIKRIREYVLPKENKRAMEAYGMGTIFGKWVIIEKETSPSRIKVILVEESLGF